MTELSAANKLEILRQQKDSLHLAGVPMSYHEKRFAQLGKPGEVINKWLVDDKGMELIRAGLSTMFIGEGQKTIDLFFTFGRALHLVFGFGIKVVHITRLARMLTTTDDRDIVTTHNTPCLFITGFQGRSPTPLTPTQQYCIEDYLFTRITNNHPVCLLAHQKVLMSSFGWWSPDFADMIDIKVHKFEIKK